MRITTVRYEKTFNLGNYETERKMAEATVEDGECPDYVMSELKAFICGESVDKQNPQYDLKDGKGEVRMTFITSKEWMDTYDAMATKAADLRSYIKQNNYIFNYIKAQATEQDSKLFLDRINQIEERLKA